MHYSLHRKCGPSQCRNLFHQCQMSTSLGVVLILRNNSQASYLSTTLSVLCIFLDILPWSTQVGTSQVLRLVLAHCFTS